MGSMPVEVHVVDHPLIADSLTRIRDVATPNALFRQELERVGISRDEHTFQPKPYVNKLPETLAGRTCIILDPMLATGGSLAHAVELLLERHATGPIIVICVLAAPEGIEYLRKQGSNLKIYTASVDERLNENAFIVPGLGDAGDRQFGAPH